MAEKQELKGFQIIKLFFEKDGGQKVTVAEMRALSADERGELAVLAAKEMPGVTMIDNPV